MKVLLHKITIREAGRFDFTVSFGGRPVKEFCACYDDSDEKSELWGTDEELFMALSELALKRFGNCAVYQMELVGILRAVEDGDKLPELPIEFGTTQYCTLRPSRWRSIWNHLAILLGRLKSLRQRIWKSPGGKNVE